MDSPLWRRLTILGITRATRSGTVIAPMCITRPDYRDEIRAGIEARGIRVTEICLTATDATLIARLTARRVDPASAEGGWVYPRAFAAAERHRSGGFGATIETDLLDATAVTDQVLSLILLSSAAR